MDNKFKITVSHSWILANNSIGKNAFNGNVIYNAEKHLVQDMLYKLRKDWFDIEKYEYVIGLFYPAHLTKLPQKINGLVDGYEVYVELK